MQTPMLLTGPLSLGDILDRAIRLYRARFGDLIPMIAILTIPIALLRIVIVNLFPPAPEFTSPSFGDPTSNLLLRLEQLSQAGGAENPIILSLAGFFSLLATLALTTQCISLVHGKTLAVRESITTGLKRFWAFFGMALLIGLAIAGVALVGIIPAVCIGPFFIIVIVPAIIYLGARWSMGTPALIAENLGPIDALRSSWNLTDGLIWRTIGFLLLSSLLGYIVMYVPAIVVGFLLAALTPLNSLTLDASINTAITTVMSILWQPIAVAATVFYYYDLRVRQEGYDLSLRVQQLEAEGRDA